MNPENQWQKVTTSVKGVGGTLSYDIVAGSGLVLCFVLIGALSACLVASCNFPANPPKHHIMRIVEQLHSRGVFWRIRGSAPAVPPGLCRRWARDKQLHSRGVLGFAAGTANLYDLIFWRIRWRGNHSDFRHQ